MKIYYDDFRILPTYSLRNMTIKEDKNMKEGQLHDQQQVKQTIDEKMVVGTGNNIDESVEERKAEKGREANKKKENIYCATFLYIVRAVFSMFVFIYMP